MYEFDKGINIVLAADDNYSSHLGVTLISLLDNFQDQRLLFIHILSDGISKKNLENLKLVGEKKNVYLFFYELTSDLLSACPEVNHLSRTSYARLFIAELLPPAIEKIIYLDSDIIVLGNIAELYDQDLRGFPLGAVADVMSKEILRIFFYHGLTNYFNAGVLVINLSLWRQMAVEERAKAFIKKYFKNMIRADQDILNCLFINNWELIDNRFNFDAKRKFFDKLPPSNTLILHYSDKIKPWHYLFIGISSRYYFYYREKTPWKKFDFKDKNLINFFKKYLLFIFKKIKLLLIPIFPTIYLDLYRYLLWKTYKVEINKKK